MGARENCQDSVQEVSAAGVRLRIDGQDPKLAELASTCKARASDAFRRSGQEGVQMHGGMGVTDEADIGFFLKRARVSELLLGDSAYHRNRFAEMRGF